MKAEWDVSTTVRIFGYMKSNIVIRSGSNPRNTKTKLSESGYAGVLVTEGGQGSFTDCQISNNHFGIELRTNRSLSVQGSKLIGNATARGRLMTVHTCPRRHHRIS
ncbi:MAG: right-handed parallel beta-helix repeat-containing protein [Pyrinomonadaceae bacterium]